VRSYSAKRRRPNCSGSVAAAFVDNDSKAIDSSLENIFVQRTTRLVASKVLRYDVDGSVLKGISACCMDPRLP